MHIMQKLAPSLQWLQFITRGPGQVPHRVFKLTAVTQWSADTAGQPLMASNNSTTSVCKSRCTVPSLPSPTQRQAWSAARAYRTVLGLKVTRRCQHTHWAQ